MTTDDRVREEKLRYDINREAARITALSSRKIDIYEYLTGEEIAPSNQREIIEQATFTYSLLGKPLERQTKAIEDQDRKQIRANQDHGKQPVESNEFVKRNFNTDRDSILEQKGLVDLINLKKELTLIISFISTKLKEDVRIIQTLNQKGK